MCRSHDLRTHDPRNFLSSIDSQQPSQFGSYVRERSHKQCSACSVHTLRINSALSPTPSIPYRLAPADIELRSLVDNTTRTVGRFLACCIYVQKRHQTTFARIVISGIISTEEEEQNALFGPDAKGEPRCGRV